MIPKSLRQPCCIALVMTGIASAAEPADEDSARDAVNILGERLVQSYPFPEISAKYQEALQANEQAGKYRGLSEGDLARQLTEDLRAVHKDVHLVVISRPRAGQGEDSRRGERRGREQNSERSRHRGIRSVELDTENSTAYIDIPGPFRPSEESFQAAAAAMTLAADSKYVILDLRQNGGGSGHMGRFIASYFFQTGDERFYLNGFHKDRTRDDQEWTYSFVPGRRNPDAKVYILVGPRTASASEGLAFAMQRMGRATIVGNNSAGAGIAGSMVPLEGSLMAFIPVKMVVAPRTTEGWEGDGVIPDISAGDEDALEVARRAIAEDREKE
ncbi:C-terminal processing protease CtpA/Prc [Haloferula luteola]|uniref:C-terminal processing protease CtpA/Prc n=1 Tax=Haloferula luteola TaxID=595692 RepID=A0A840V4H7_9BACT|nr:S41 family peptidase [Haloferula luteola]MBB5350544.1 C-terminal processing protease CtpA/Prc [Haloferula luteola]